MSAMWLIEEKPFFTAALEAQLSIAPPSISTVKPQFVQTR